MADDKTYFKSSVYKCFGLTLFLIVLIANIHILLDDLFQGIKFLCLRTNLALFACIYCFRHAKRLESKDAEKILIKDTRLPILYLRPFTAEKRRSSFTSVIFRLYPKKMIDEEIADIINKLGPFVTINDPIKSLQELGAYRKNVNEKKWKEDVYELMHRSQLILILAAGTDRVSKSQQNLAQADLNELTTSPYRKPKGLENNLKYIHKFQRKAMKISKGLSWEVREAIQLNTPKKIILMVPKNLTQYDAFRKSTKTIFPNYLPQIEKNKNRFKWYYEAPSILGFIYFDSVWEPRYIKIRTPSFRESMKDSNIERTVLLEAFKKATEGFDN